MCSQKKWKIFNKGAGRKYPSYTWSTRRFLESKPLHVPRELDSNALIQLVAEQITVLENYPQEVNADFQSIQRCLSVALASVCPGETSGQQFINCIIVVTLLEISRLHFLICKVGRKIPTPSGITFVNL